MLEHIKILTVLIALLLLPGLVHYAQAAEETSQKERVLAPYPKEARLAYMQSCVGSSHELIPYCKCMINALEKRYTVDEMIRITRAAPEEQEKYAKALANHCAGKK